MGKFIKWHLAEKWSLLQFTGRKDVRRARSRGAEDAQSGAIHVGEQGFVEGPGIGVFEQELARNAFWPVFDLDRDSEQAHELLAPLWSEYRSLLSRRNAIDAKIAQARISSEAKTDFGNVEGDALEQRRKAQVQLDLQPLVCQREALNEELSRVAREAEEVALPMYRRMTSRRRAEAKEHLARANELLNHYICGAAPHLDVRPKAQAMDEEWVESMWQLYRLSLQGDSADDGRFVYDFGLHLPENKSA